MELSEVFTQVFNFLNKNYGALSVLFTAVLTVSTVIYVKLTLMLVSETKRMREVQTEPKIEITIKSFDFAVNFVRLHVKNIGLGPAMNVSFTLSVISGGEAAQVLLKEFTQTNFFKVGLKYFGPGQDRFSHFTQLGQGHEGKIESVLAIDIAYESASGAKYKEQAIIDMSELKGQYQLGTPDLHSIAKSLEKIQSNFADVTSRRKINTNIYTYEDRTREEEEIKSWHEGNLDTKQRRMHHFFSST